MIIQKISQNRHKMRASRHGMPAFRPGVLIIDKESIHRGAPHPCGAPMLPLSIMRTPGLNAGIPCLMVRILCLFGLIFWIIMAIPYSDWSPVPHFVLPRPRPPNPEDKMGSRRPLEKRPLGQNEDKMDSASSEKTHFVLTLGGGV